MILLIINNFLLQYQDKIILMHERKMELYNIYSFIHILNLNLNFFTLKVLQKMCLNFFQKILNKFFTYQQNLYLLSLIQI